MSEPYIITASSIFIRDLRIFARHGVLPQERTVGAMFVLNISIDTDITQAAQSDDIASTVSYAEVVALVQHQMEIPSNLLEHVAHRIASAILTAFPATTAVTINLLKENPPMGTDCTGAGVTLRMERQ